VLHRWHGSLLVIVCSLSLRAAAQWIATGYAGAAHTVNSSLTIRQPALGTAVQFSGITYRGESFQPPLYYGVRGGHLFGRWWGVEAEFIHLKVFLNVDQPATVTGILNGTPIHSSLAVNAIVQRFSISHGVNLLLGSAVFRHQIWRAGQGRFARGYVSLRLGAGASIPHAESIIQGLTDEHYQAGSPVLQMAGSLELRIYSRLYWMGEYKFTRTHEQVSVNSGTATSLLKSNHLVTGPSIHF
jgi:hypothetical protein